MNLFLFTENYQKNLLCMQEATDELLSHMKGHSYSFQPEITDRKGNFSQEKLSGLVEELLSLWTARLREVTDVDSVTGESVAEPYIRARQELYRSYLYLVMRCSLCRDAYVHIHGYIKRAFWSDREVLEYEYAHSRGDDIKERPDFAFLLKQAKHLSRNWCVMADSDGRKWNGIYEGYDRHFGFHLYHALNTPWGMLERNGLTEDDALTPEWEQPWNHLDLLTDEGNQKRFFIRHLSSQKYVPASRTEGAEETAQPDEDGYSGPDEDSYDDMDSWIDEDGYDEPDYEDDGLAGAFGYGDDWEFPELYGDAEFQAGKLDQWAEEADRAEWLKHHARKFECPEEYLAACRSFKALFEKAQSDVLRGFYEDLEEIVDLYLEQRGASPLTDTDKTMDVHSRVSDGACRQARLCERGLRWKRM